MTEHTSKTLPQLSRNRKIALVIAALLLALGVAGLTNVSRISNFMESSGAFSSISEPTGNTPAASTSSTSTLDPSTPVSSDGSVGETPSSTPNSPGSTPPSGGSEPGSSGSGSTGSAPSKPSSTGKEQPAVDPVAKPSTNGATTPAPAAPQESAPKPTKISVHIRVDASAAVDKGFSGSSTMLSKNVSVAPGTSALDASKASGISFKTRGTALGTYVAAIGSLAEKDYGSASGWTYSVNGSTPSKSSSKYVVEDGDSVTWIYVIN